MPAKNNLFTKLTVISMVLLFVVSTGFAETEFGGEEDGDLSEWTNNDLQFSIEDGLMEGSDNSILRGTDSSRLESRTDIPVGTAKNYSITVASWTEAPNTDFGFIDSDGNAMWYFWLSPEAGGASGGLYWGEKSARDSGTEILSQTQVDVNETFEIKVTQIDPENNEVNVVVESLSQSDYKNVTLPYHTSTADYPSQLELACNAGTAKKCAEFDNISYSTGSSNAAPSADFDYNPDIAVTGEQISFDGSSSSDSDGSISSYSWDFGDGSTATGQTVSNTYSSEGKYAVTLNVTDDDGSYDATTKTIHVKPESYNNCSDLIANYHFNGSGNVVTDYSKCSNDVDAVNDVTLGSQGFFKSSGNWFDQEAVFFDGSAGDEYIDLGSATLHEKIESSDQFTFSMWAKINSDEGARSILRGTGLKAEGANGRLKFAIGDTEVFLLDRDIDYELNKWTHIFWNFNGTHSQLYFNNTSIGQEPVTNDYTSLEGLTLSAADASTPRVFDGKIDELKIFNESKNESVKTQLYETNLFTDKVPEFNKNADFSFEPLAPETGETVKFYDQSANSEEIINYDWSFADGSSSSQENPTHTFSSAGEYNVQLTVTYSDEVQETKEFLVDVDDTQPLTYYGGTGDGSLSEWYGEAKDGKDVSLDDAVVNGLGRYSINLGTNSTRVELKQDLPVNSSGKYSIVFQPTATDANNDFGFKDEDGNALWYFFVSPEAGGSLGGIYYSTPNDDDSSSSRDSGEILLEANEVDTNERFNLTISDIDTSSNEVNVTVESLDDSDYSSKIVSYHNTASDFPDYIELASNDGDAMVSTMKYDAFSYGADTTYTSKIDLISPEDNSALGQTADFNFSSTNMSTTNLLFNTGSSGEYRIKQSYNFSVSSADTSGTRKLLTEDGPDADSYDDIFTGHLSGGAWYYESNESAEGYYNDPVELVNNGGSGLSAANDGVSVGDVNNDGYLDLFVGTSTDLRIRYGNPNSDATALNSNEVVPFNQTQVLGSTGDENDYTAIGHADQDHSTGKDLFINTDFDQKVWVLRRNNSKSDGYNDPEQLIDVGFSSDSNSIVTTDLNGDGVSDLIFGKYDDSFSTNDSRIYVLLSDTSEPNNYRNSALELSRFSTGYKFVSERNNGFTKLDGEMELNDDGIADLLVAARGTVHLFLSNDSKNDYYNEPIQVNGDWGIDNNLKQADVAFVNDDNKPDIIVPHNNQNEVYILYGDDSSDRFTEREVLKDYSDYGPNAVGMSKFVETAATPNTVDVVVQERIQSNSPISIFEIGKSFEIIESTTAENFTGVDLSRYTGESLKWMVNGTDTKSNTVETNAQLFTVEEETVSKPQFSLIHPDTVYPETSVPLDISGGDNTDSWNYNIDGGSNQSFTPNTTISSVSEGDHVVNVFAENGSGVIKSSSEFTVDVSGPITSFNSASTGSGEQNQSFVYTEISSYDTITSVFSVVERFNGQNRTLSNVDDDNFAFNHTGLSDGIYTVEIWSTDGAGNTVYTTRDITLNTSDSGDGGDDSDGGDTGPEYFVKHLAQGKVAGLTSDPSRDLTSNGVSGVNNAVFGDNSDSELAAELEIDFNNNVSAANFAFAANRSQGKAFLHNYSSISGLQTATLLVPRESGSGKVHVCPGAESLSAVNSSCQNGYNVSTGEMVNGVTVSETSISGSDYYRVEGISGTGAQEINTTEDDGGGFTGGGGGGSGGDDGDGDNTDTGSYTVKFSHTELMSSAGETDENEYIEIRNFDSERNSVEIDVPSTGQCRYFSVQRQKGEGVANLEEFGGTGSYVVEGNGSESYGALRVGVKVDMPNKTEIEGTSISCEPFVTVGNGQAEDLKITASTPQSFVDQISGVLNGFGLPDTQFSVFQNVCTDPSQAVNDSGTCENGQDLAFSPATLLAQLILLVLGLIAVLFVLGLAALGLRRLGVPLPI